MERSKLHRRLQSFLVPQMLASRFGLELAGLEFNDHVAR
jgi:hypothetical protein